MPRARTPAASRSPHAITSTADFARHVGLARTTVSRVINGHPGVKAKTIERVRRAMAETGFTPNAYALHLKGKRTTTMGICLENLSTPTIVAKLSRLQAQLRARGFTALIEVQPPGEGRKVLQHFLSMRVEAVAFIGQFPAEEFTESVAGLRQRNVPHIVLDQNEIPAANTVSLDRAAGMQGVVERLLADDHRHFGLLGISGRLHTIRERLRGIEAALRAHGLDPALHTRSLDYLATRETDFSYGRQLAHHFARLPDQPTAYLALNDEIATGAMLEFQDLGRDVPGEISIVGFNNQDICQITRPALSSVDQQIETTVTAAVELLTRQLTHPTTDVLQQRIAPVFVPRGSSGRAPTAH